MWGLNCKIKIKRSGEKQIENKLDKSKTKNYLTAPRCGPRYKHNILYEYRTTLRRRRRRRRGRLRKKIYILMRALRERMPPQTLSRQRSPEIAEKFKYELSRARARAGDRVVRNNILYIYIYRYAIFGTRNRSLFTG